jgi:tetratricopeptide (TPR) repeat protein
MHPLDRADLMRLQAAEGWLELGNPAEARAELDQISPEYQCHPDVLRLRWQELSDRKEWSEALEVAAAILQADPGSASGWVHRSYCLHELKRTQEARDNLLRVVDQFPDSVIMRYNLACYECQLGRLEQARNWLEKAIQLGDPQKLKTMALQDPDLKPLWNVPSSGGT